MTEDTGYCLFCNQLTNLTKGRDEGNPGRFIQAWVTKIEIEDCFGLKSVHEGKGTMFLCQACRKRMHEAIENNAKMVSQ
ncbi:hypothetical protein M0R72_20040 [Candidatus Pacearchaeota archaeon]|jgi:hypothetical protein|nr:hypothetical protein [Candidatus Pacearchaeota archaeon]